MKKYLQVIINSLYILLILSSCTLPSFKLTPEPTPTFEILPTPDYMNRIYPPPGEVIELYNYSGIICFGSHTTAIWPNHVEYDLSTWNNILEQRVYLIVNDIQLSNDELKIIFLLESGDSVAFSACWNYDIDSESIYSVKLFILPNDTWITYEWYFEIIDVPTPTYTLTPTPTVTIGFQATFQINQTQNAIILETQSAYKTQNSPPISTPTP